MGDTRQSIYKELDVIRVQLLMMVKEAADRVPGVTTVEHTVTKLQRIPHKLGGGVVAAIAIVLISPSSTLLKTNITGITDLHHVLTHANIARLGASKGTGSRDGVFEGMCIGEVDPALFIYIVGCTQ